MLIRFAEFIFYITASGLAIVLIGLLSKYARERKVAVYGRIMRLVIVLCFFATLPAQWFVVERIKVFFGKGNYDVTSMVLWSIGIIIPLIYIYSNMKYFFGNTYEKDDESESKDET